MNRSRLVLLLVVAGALGAGGAALSCNLMDAVTCDSDEFNLTAGTVGNFGGDEASQKIEAFLQATIDLNRKATNLATSLTSACLNIGRAIGLTDTEMQPASASASDDQKIRAACTPVATAIGETIRDALPTGFTLSLVYQPPQCQASFDVYAGCAADCDVNVDHGSFEAECQPGTVGIGECGATCSGGCWVEASAACTGSCSATCTGSCSGACYGTCSAGCAYESSPGVCAGACTGTCTGQCSATCNGSCSGTCVFDASAGCTGECHGQCDVWVTPPHCEVYVEPPSISVDCQASCEARARANLTCTRPSLTVNYGQLGGDAGARDRLRALVTALRDNYPAVLGAAGEVGEAVVNLVESFFSALDGFTDSLTAAIDAFACGLKAFEVSAQVSLTFSASFDATASITGAVAVEGSAM
jgi:hypothetical protein